MTKEKVVAILVEAGLWERGQEFTDYVRFPCPWRKWNHIGSKGRAGNNFWLKIETLNGGCFVCDHHSALWEILMFRGLLDKRPHLVNLAYEVLLAMPDGKKDPVADAFDTATSKLETIADYQERLAVIRRLRTFFEDLPCIPTPAVEYYRSGRKFPFADPITLVDRFNLRYDADECRVLQPLYDLYKGEFAGVTGRSTLPDGEVPNKAKVYYGTEKTLTFGVRKPEAFWSAKKFIIVEGATSMYRVDLLAKPLDPSIEVLCLNGWKLSDEQIALLALRFVPVMLLLDNDKRGKGGTDYGLDTLNGLLPQVVRGVLPDGVNDPDELSTSEQMREILAKGSWL